MTTGIIVFAHGSRVESANQAVRSVAAELARAGGYTLVEAAFLELGQPDLVAAAAGLLHRGADRLIVLPYFLTPGLHMERDLAPLIARISAAHPGIEVTAAPSLDGHPGLVQALLDRARALDQST
ncbi:MAG TPA: CbiX/SirB N-terminal domain-containing protein [Verrucomicrobiae bacterium]|nr:CbiX/SirB N-terminal domain-containing protein [Verrucomicrobiae bacterium]